MPTYLITGANRGIGLEFVRQLSARGSGTMVLATAREAEKAADLALFVDGVLPLDVSDPVAIAGLANKLANQPIDVLINNAGVGSDSRSIEKLDPAELQRVFTINTFGPMLVTKALLTNLRAGKRKTVFNVTSQLGSISDNKGGSSYGYRASKSALNQMTVCLANELRGQGFTCVAVHPGWVRTDMGGPNATLATEDSVKSMLTLLDGLTPEDTGKYFNYDGAILPW